MNLKHIIKELEMIADSHSVVKGFGFGDILNISDKDRQYPLMWVVPTQAVIINSQLTISLDIMLMDLERSDDDGLIDVQTEMLAVCTDIVTILESPDNDDTMLSEDPITIEPFTVRFSDNVAGWVMSPSIDQARYDNLCEVPLNTIP